MSKLINELKNCDCKLSIDRSSEMLGKEILICHVVDVDDEWLKVSFMDKKKNQVTKLIRIENIDDVELQE